MTLHSTITHDGVFSRDRLKVVPPTSASARAGNLAASRSARSNLSAFLALGSIIVVIVLFALWVVGCKDLLVKDTNGFSDPFVVVSLPSIWFQTPVSKRTISPTYATKDATFDFSIYLSLTDHDSAELFVWDNVMFSKDYLGEVTIPLEDWFSSSHGGAKDAYGFDNPNNKVHRMRCRLDDRHLIGGLALRPFSMNLLSTRASTHATGTVEMKLGFTKLHNTLPLSDFSEIFNNRSRPSLISAPPTKGIGTVLSHQGGPAFEDDGSLSSENDNDGEHEEDEDAESPSLSHPSSRPSDGRRQPSAGADWYRPWYTVYTYSFGSCQDVCGG